MAEEVNDLSILVVEDEKPLLDAIRIKLEKKNFKVTTARTAEQAYSYITEGVKADAIWLDHYLLGEESGLDLVTKLKKDDSEYKDIPIYVVSNTATEDKVQSYIKLGVTKYYAKVSNRLDDIASNIYSDLKKK